MCDNGNNRENKQFFFLSTLRAKASMNFFAYVGVILTFSRTPMANSADGRLKTYFSLENRVHVSLRKHAYSNIWKISPPKKINEIFQIKNSDIFHISAQNIDCGYSLEPPRRGGSNEYPQSMFYAVIRKNNVYHCKPQFYYIKVGFKGVKII